MLGKNKVAAPFRHEDGSLLVNDLFLTIQGEGPDAGRPAVFLRLARCNLRCYFCDTEFETGSWRNLHDISTAILRIARPSACNLVVITGGEPLLQNIVPLVRNLNVVGIQVSVETAGTVFAPDLEKAFQPDRSIGGNLIVCSPKTPILNRDLVPLIGAYKYLVGMDGFDERDGLPDRSTQMPGQSSRIFRPPADNSAAVYMQAIDTGDPASTADNQRLAASLAIQFNRRLSVQIHKVVGLP